MWWISSAQVLHGDAPCDEVCSRCDHAEEEQVQEVYHSRIAWIRTVKLSMISVAGTMKTRL